MDEQLQVMLGLVDSTGHESEPNCYLKIVDDVCGRIEITPSDDDASPKQFYALKPLDQLYEDQSDLPEDQAHPNLQSSAYRPLFYAIEEEIVRADKNLTGLTDGAVEAALDLLQGNPEGNVKYDAVAHHIQLNLRLSLSLNPYTRQEVRQALRKISKSVQRHHRVAGRRGYLDFIRQYIPI